jgi:hypothetical protein
MRENLLLPEVSYRQKKKRKKGRKKKTALKRSALPPPSFEIKPARAVGNERVYSLKEARERNMPLLI